MERAIPYAILYLFIFTVGTVIASFINVLIYRVPRKIDFVHGRSMCPHCGHELSGRDLIPILSYILLHSKCRYCGQRISPRYAVVEAIGGIFAVLSCVRYGFTFTAVASFAFLAGLLLIAFTDWDTQIIPNGFVIYLCLPSLALVFLLPETSLLSHLIGIFCIALPLFLINLFIPDAFGGGDMKLMAVIGLALGWKLTLFAFFIGLLSCGVQAVYVLKKINGEKESG